MLNILKVKQNDKVITNGKHSVMHHKINKYLPATKLWIDSAYNYNNVNNKLISYNNNIVDYIFNTYFNFYKLRTYYTSKKNLKIVKKIKDESCKRLYISSPEIKHTNDKVIFTVYTYNKEQHVLYNKLKSHLEKLSKLILPKRYKIRRVLKRRMTIRLKKFLLNIYKWNSLFNNLSKFKNMISSYNINSKVLSTISNINNFYYKPSYKVSIRKYIRTIYKRIRKALYISKLLFIEGKKGNNVFLNYKGIGIIGILKKLYGKNIQIDIINHKSIYMNSDIVSKVVAFKLKNRKASLSRILRKILLRKIVSRKLYLKINPKQDLKQNVLSNLKYKVISGVRLEVSGRLTKRLTAMRSVHKVNYRGGKKNFLSSNKKLSVLLVRNDVNPNIQYTRLNGTTRNGAFGLKCWVNNM